MAPSWTVNGVPCLWETVLTALEALSHARLAENPLLMFLHQLDSI